MFIDLVKLNWVKIIGHKGWYISLPGGNKTGHWFDYKYIKALMFLYGFIGMRCSPSNQPEVSVRLPLLSPTYKWISNSKNHENKLPNVEDEFKNGDQSIEDSALHLVSM